MVPSIFFFLLSGRKTIGDKMVNVFHCPYAVSVIE